MKTEALNIDQINETRTFNTSLSLPSKTLVAQNTQEIKVTINISANVIEQDFSAVQIQLRDETKLLDPNEAIVTLSIPEGQVSNLPELLVVQVNIPKDKKNIESITFNDETSSLFSLDGIGDIDAKIINIQPSTFTIRDKDE